MKARKSYEREEKSKRERKIREKQEDELMNFSGEVLGTNKVFMYFFVPAFFIIIIWMYATPPANPENGRAAVGWYLLGSALFASVPAVVAQRSITRWKLWVLAKPHTGFRLWHAPVGGTLSFPVLGLLFGMSLNGTATAMLLGLVVGSAASWFMFRAITNDTAERLRDSEEDF